MALSVGETVGDYQVIQVLGYGGMGAVYKVRHLISERLEALKLVLPELTDNLELADRFMREIKVQARLNHPNIASLHNAFRVGNQLFMVMEFIEGRTLHTALRKSALDLAAGIDIALQILSALEYAHAQGVVHRDIKPANIMLTMSNQVKLMDFGIARSLGDDEQLTRTGSIVGSMYYISPEQVQGTAVDLRADLYAVGVLLYEMAAGVRPITGESSWTVMQAHVHTVPRSPSSVNPALPEAFSSAILKALEKDPNRRFQSAQAFSRSLIGVRPGVASSVSERGSEAQRASLREIEATVPAPTPAGPVSAAATPPPLTASVRFEPERLETLTRELALFVGPMAKVLVSRAAKRAQTWRQVYDILALEVPEGAERKQFLSKRPWSS